MGHKRNQQDKQRNLVAKHARTFNKAHVMADRKVRQKRGYTKHKGQQGDTNDG